MGGALWATGVGAGIGDSAGGVDSCGIHSSLRSSSHGCDMLPNIAASVRGVAEAEGDAQFVVVAVPAAGARYDMGRFDAGGMRTRRPQLRLNSACVGA